MQKELTINRQQFLLGSDIRNAVYAIQAGIEKYRDAINKLNVFPVPDGDTGSNLGQTVDKVAADLKKLDSDSINEMLALIVKSSLMGARGNSGVIYSQIVRGMCEALIAEPAITGKALVDAFKKGVEVSYQSVIKPVEGTMLTVISGAAETCATAFAKDPSIGPIEILEWAGIGAKKALESTPELLPVLKEAGVVDAGGYGLVIMLESVTAVLKNEELQNIDEIVTGEMSEEAKEMELTYGYCTEFVLKTEILDENSLEDNLAGIGDSIVIAGGKGLWRIHVHTDEPGQALSLGTARGEISDVKINNMREQVQDFKISEPKEVKEVAIIAVASGEGNKEILRSLSVEGLIDGGQSMNPSTEEILAAIEQTPAQNIIILPNNKNVIMTAKLAADMSRKAIEVVETTSMPQAFSILMEFNPISSSIENATRMRENLGNVRVGEITRAVRDSKTNGITIKEGEYLAIVDDKIIASKKDMASAINSLTGELIKDESEVITVLLGKDASDEQRVLINRMMTKSAGERQLEVHEGGQEVYSVIISVE